MKRFENVYSSSKGSIVESSFDLEGITLKTQKFSEPKILAAESAMDPYLRRNSMKSGMKTCTQTTNYHIINYYYRFIKTYFQD